MKDLSPSSCSTPSIPGITAGGGTTGRESNFLAVVFYVTGLVGVWSCASSVSAQSFFFTNTASYSINGRVAASGIGAQTITQSDLVQEFNTISKPAVLKYDLNRLAKGPTGSGEVKAKVVSIANRGRLSVLFDGTVNASTDDPLGSGFASIDNASVIARWQDTLIFAGNSPGQTTTITAVLVLEGSLEGGASYDGLQDHVNASSINMGVNVAAWLGNKSIVSGESNGALVLNGVPGSTNPRNRVKEAPRGITLVMTFTEGQVYTLDYRLSVGLQAYAILHPAGAAMPEQSATAFFNADYSHTLVWGGITSVTDTLTGVPIENYTLTSTSGLDYTKPIPELPEVPDLPFSIVSVEFSSGTSLLEITWNSRPGETYAVETSANLLTWVKLTDNAESQGTTTSFSTVVDYAMFPELFTRVLRLSQP